MMKSGNGVVEIGGATGSSTQSLSVQAICATRQHFSPVVFQNLVESTGSNPSLKNANLLCPQQHFDPHFIFIKVYHIYLVNPEPECASEKSSYP